MRNLVLLVVVLLMGIAFAGCQQGAEQGAETKAYVQETWSISMRAKMLSEEANRVFREMSEDEKLKLGSDKSRDYSNKFTGLVQDLTSLETPEECQVFRYYMNHYSTLSSSEWMAYSLFFSLADESYRSQAQTYNKNANRFLALGYEEGERLGKEYNFNPRGDATVAEE